ncbi:MAG TPA: hypothetical protein VGB57_11520 [Allosphingosinicella sp.]
MRGTFAASILLAASLAAAPASAAKKPPPPPPPVEDPDDPWAGCTPYGSYDYFKDCCGYPELVVPCESPASDPVIRPEEASAESSGQ